VLIGLLALALAAQPRAAAAGELLGDPGGQRSRLQRLGVVLQLFYNQYLTGKPEGGGVNPDGEFGHSGSYDFFARVDLEALSGWPGADFLLHLKGQYDRNVNEDVGALSDPIDDADFDAPLYVDELWLQQTFLADRLRFRLGFLEQQTYFDRNAYANSEDRQFLSAFLDNNGVVPLPNGIGAIALLAPLPWLEIALGAADADNTPRTAGFATAFDGIDSVTGYLELRLASPLERHGLPGAVRFGAFLDGRALTDFRSGRVDRGHAGAYLSFDQLAFREGPEGPQGLGLFARGGRADPDVNRIAWFWSLGLQYQGALPSRNGDILGLGVFQAIGSDVYREAIDPRFDRETGIELYYRIEAFSWLAVTPDFQYIVDPGATGTADDAIVATLRLRVSF
jgi:porin